MSCATEVGFVVDDDEERDGKMGKEEKELEKRVKSQRVIYRLLGNTPNDRLRNLNFLPRTAHSRLP